MKSLAITLLLTVCVLAQAAPQTIEMTQQECFASVDVVDMAIALRKSGHSEFKTFQLIVGQNELSTDDVYLLAKLVGVTFKRDLADLKDMRDRFHTLCKGS